MNAQQNKQVVQEAYRLFQTGDIPGLLELCRDDAEWSGLESEFIPFSGKFHGKQGIAQFFSKLDASTQMIHFEPREMIAEGDKVVVMGQGAWQVKSTGRRYETPWIHVFTLRDGKMARFESMIDMAAGERAFQPDRASMASTTTQLHH